MRIFGFIPAALASGLGILGLVGCGVPGAPLPPSLDIPMAVRDLRAVRKGDTVTLSWTAPKNTTDGALVSKPGKMIVQRAVLPDDAAPAPSAKSTVAEVPLEPTLKRRPRPKERGKGNNREGVTRTDSLGELARSSASPEFAVYTVEAVNRAGKSAGPSNRASVFLAPLPPPPAEVRVEDVPRGVSISWEQSAPPSTANPLESGASRSSSIAYSYRIMRRQEGSKQPPAMIAQVPATAGTATYTDRKIEWGSVYSYWIVPMAQWKVAEGKGREEQGEAEGGDSPVASLAAIDRFPPAVPGGLQAVSSQGASPPYIDLTWTPDNDEDLAGYNVYRWNDNEPPVKINAGLAPAPAFRDTAVRPGTRYFYAVSAVDLRGNESARSAQAEETASPGAP